MRLEVDQMHLGDRAEEAIRTPTCFLLDHAYIVALHEGRRWAQIPVKQGGASPETELPPYCRCRTSIRASTPVP
jgi:hypothetical protein